MAQLKKEKPAVAVHGMIMKSVYLTQEQLIFLQTLENDGQVADRSKFMRACIDYARKNQDNLKAVLSYVEA